MTTHTPITGEELEAMKRSVWEWIDRVIIPPGIEDHEKRDRVVVERQRELLAEAARNARQFLPRLIAEVERLNAEVKKLREVKTPNELRIEMGLPPLEGPTGDPFSFVRPTIPQIEPDHKS